MHVPCSIVLAVSLSAPLLAAEPAQQVWEIRGGQWTEIKSPATSRSSDPALDRIDALLQAGNHVKARQEALAWEKTHKASPLRDRVLYQIAMAYFQYGDRTRAFFHLDELLDTYPESPLFYPALQLQYRIADAYLGGYKRRFMKMAIVGAEEDGIEMMYRIQQRSPGSPLAEQALLRTADYYFSASRFEFAADAYTQYVRSYPRSPEVPRVRLHSAYASLAQFRGLRYDPTPLTDARTQLEAIIVDYPQMAAEENLTDLINRIDTTFARKALLTADFYRRTNQPVGSAYTYRYVTRVYPDTPESMEAEKAFAGLPEDAQAAVKGDAGWHAPMASPSEGPQ